MSQLDRVRAYYADCNTGDADAVARHFTDDAEHLFTRLPPLRGARAIADQTARAVEHAQATWEVEHGIEAGDEAVIEFLNCWTDLRSGERRTIRGTEWFRFAPDGRIAQVRAYYHREGLVTD
ncbi:MAG TPA: nuclear transport factor 2 family protein [Solirubrobacteraceae bacterium]|nr:nuclear transport factor 2 family protein [Solirubrobacteraceae bacterium]